MNDTHETMGPLLSAYLDGELDPAHRRLVAAHLATCAICTEELEHLRAGDEALAGLRPTPMAPDLRPRLRRRLRRQGARTALSGGLIGLIILLLRAVARDLAIVKRKDLPLWGRMGIVSSHLLMVAPGIALCVELLHDVRTLVEYAWLSDESIDSGGPQS
ncbi:MAG TPA: zf-HC2 domain-containing protein [Chloroflexota bacterium]